MDSEKQVLQVAQLARGLATAAEAPTESESRSQAEKALRLSTPDEAIDSRRAQSMPRIGPRRTFSEGSSLLRQSDLPSLMRPLALQQAWIRAKRTLFSAPASFLYQRMKSMSPSKD